MELGAECCLNLEEKSKEKKQMIVLVREDSGSILSRQGRGSDRELQEEG